LNQAPTTELEHTRMTTWLHQKLGEHSIVGTAAQNARWEGTGQLVVEVVDASGERWFAKQVADPQCWRFEVRAYRRWVPALGEHAPTLKAADRDSHLLLLGAVPGVSPSAADMTAHRQAGALLRRLHEVKPAREQRPGHQRNANGPLHALLRDVPGLLSEEQEHFARHRLRQLESLPPAPMVPCHGDYNTHNWLVDASGTLRVIDFGNSRWQIPALEFARLYFGPWWYQPHLAEAFFEGYGRRPDDRELEFVRHRVVVRAVQEIAFGLRRSSQRHVDFGRSRLDELMAAHDVTRRDPVLGKVRRRARDLLLARRGSTGRDPGAAEVP
jgi:Ser/Thr protein kinase RdoA (MazF antagonist)